MNLKPYTLLKDKHVGETAFVLGSGTSLNNLDISGIHKHVVICVNSSILLMDWEKGKADKRYWISNDAFCRKWSYWKYVMEAKANRVVRDSWRKYFRELEGFYVFSPRPTDENSLNVEDEGLCHCSSVPSALDLALQMGCKKIFLLGADHYIRGAMGRRYFWEHWDRKKRPHFKGMIHSRHHQMRIFILNNKMYNHLDRFASYKKASVYNCSLSSQIDAFEKISLEDALKKIG
jgi:hypothetical protein